MLVPILTLALTQGAAPPQCPVIVSQDSSLTSHPHPCPSRVGHTVQWPHQLVLWTGSPSL